MLKSLVRRRAGRAAVTTIGLGLLLGLLGSPEARAGECTAPGGAAAALGEKTVEARLQFMQSSMRDTVRLERRYALGWSLSYVGMAAGTWFLYPIAEDKHGQLISSSWNSATSVVAALNVLIDQLRVVGDQHKLEALLAAPHPAAERCAVVAKAEKLFIHAADNEKSARSPRAHILSFLSTVGLGLIFGYALQRPESAAINTGIGVVLSELMIATRPTLAMQRLERYRSGELELTAPPPSVLSWSVVPNFTSTSYGAAWAGAF